MKAYRRSRGIDPLILNLGTGWRGVVNFTLATLYPRERIPVSIEYVKASGTYIYHCGLKS
jgi:hypothetical protein